MQMSAKTFHLIKILIQKSVFVLFRGIGKMTRSLEELPRSVTGLRIAWAGLALFLSFAISLAISSTFIYYNKIIILN